MRIATYIKPASQLRGDARLYQLSEPLEGSVHVVVSGIGNEWGAETYIFAADSKGSVTNWGELPGSFKGAIDHAAALRDAGYEIVS